MEPVSSYSKNYKVEVDHVDFNGSLKLSSLFTYFQDIAGLHSENLNMGMETLYENHNVLWVLARIRVDIIRYPLLNEEIIIDTWPQEPDRVGFARDFLVRDIQGNILAKAVSTWVIIDVNTRRLKKTKSVYTGYPPTVKERAIDCKLRYSDIDVNKHLNNSKYVDFIMDCFSLKDHEKYSIKSIEVNYSKEALPGDSIIIYKDISEVNSNLIYIEGINEKDNKLTFKTQLELEAK